MHEHWNIWRTKPVVDLESALRELPADDFLQKGDILSQFIGFARKLDIMPEGLLRQLLRTPFTSQCDSQRTMK
jgi:hypothetical protein